MDNSVTNSINSAIKSIINSAIKNTVLIFKTVFLFHVKLLLIRIYHKPSILLITTVAISVATVLARINSKVSVSCETFLWIISIDYQHRLSVPIINTDHQY